MARQMKDSGIEWIGMIPEAWKIIKIKNVTEIQSGAYVAKEDYIDDGIYDIIGSNGKIGSINKKNIEKTVITTGRVGSIGTVHVVKDVWVTDNALIIFNKENIILEYLAFILPLFPYDLISTGTAQPLITATTLKNQYIPIQSLLEQQIIADFLDEKVTEIDAAIEKTKATIEDYRKYKLSVIDEVFINVKSRKYKFRYLGELKNGLNYQSTTASKKIKFLGVGDFKNLMILDNKECFSDLPIDTELPSEYLLKNGDIVFVRSNGSKELVGRSVLVENVDYDLTYSGFCIRFRNQHSDIVDNKYLLYFFRSNYFKELLKMGSSGMAINNLSQDVLNSVKISIPSLEEQQEFVDYLDTKCTEIDNLITNKEAIIEELQAYKKSLIYEYVTGKKEVE